MICLLIRLLRVLCWMLHHRSHQQRDRPELQVGKRLPEINHRYKSPLQLHKKERRLPVGLAAEKHLQYVHPYHCVGATMQGNPVHHRKRRHPGVGGFCVGGVGLRIVEVHRDVELMPDSQ